MLKSYMNIDIDVIFLGVVDLMIVNFVGCI